MRLTRLLFVILVSAPALPAGAAGNADAIPPELLCRRLAQLQKDMPDLDGCVMDMKQVQKESPDGYLCAAGCLRELELLKTTMCWAKCTSSYPALGKVKEHKARDTVVAWTRLPGILAKGEVTPAAPGAKPIAYQLALPNGIATEPPSPATPDKRRYTLGASNPRLDVTVSTRPWKGLNTLLPYAQAAGREILQKSETGDSYRLVTASKLSVDAAVGKKLGANALECRAEISRAVDEAELTGKVLPFLQKICETLSVAR